MSNSSEPIHPSPNSPPRRVLLVGWEGADWRVMQPLVDAGEMPHLTAMIERGVMGNIASLIPMVCPLLWTSVATGVFADRHDILTAIEPDGGGARAVQSTSRRRKALWNILSQSGLRSAVIGWPATHPPEPIEGVVVPDRFFRSTPTADTTPCAEDHSPHPPELHHELTRLRVSLSQLGRQQIASFVPRVNEIDHEADPRVSWIAALLAQAASVQQVATWAALRATWHFMAVYYGMLGGLNHGFMQYHPPCDDSVAGRDAELYGDVIKTGYRFHDMMLGRLNELAGPETLVMLVSDHGFNKHRGPPAAGQPRSSATGAQPDENVVIDPYAPFRNHRRDAFFCTAGPGVRNDELVFGTRLVDVAPTILASLGLPVPRDMDGKVINKIFEIPPAQRSTESYETCAKNDGVHHWELTEDTWASNEIVENLSALGLAHLDSKTAAVLEVCVRQRRLNLAQSLASQTRFAEAADAYRAALELEDPLWARLPYIECLLKLERLDEAETEVTKIAGAVPDAAVTHLLQARLAVERGDPTTAESCLDKLQDIDASNIGVSLQLGWMALQLRRWEQAASLFENILENDPECAQAHDGLGVTLLHLGRIVESVSHHTQSVRLLYHRSAAHEHLGESLVAAGQLDWAERAFKIALELDPGNKRAVRWLHRVENLQRNPRRGRGP